MQIFKLVWKNLLILVIMLVVIHYLITNVLELAAQVSLFVIVPTVLLVLPVTIVGAKCWIEFGKSFGDVQLAQKDPVTGSDMEVLRTFMAQRPVTLVIVLASFVGTMALSNNSILTSLISYFFAIGGSITYYRHHDKLLDNYRKQKEC